MTISMSIPDSMKRHVLKIMQGEYDLNIPCQSPTILDIGANIGAFSIWALQKWSNAIIYAYEPISSNFDYLEKNTKGLNVICVKAAIRDISDKTGIMYHGINNCGEASFYDLGGQDMASSEEVEIVSVKSLPKADIVKIDTEGCELEILKGLDLSLAKGIMLEVHRETDLIQIRQTLEDFTLILRPYPGRWNMKFIRQELNNAQRTRGKAKERSQEKRLWQEAHRRLCLWNA